MFSNWLLVSVSIGYIGLLFLIAYLGGKYRHKLVHKQQAVIYALSLGVYCTSWGFLGTSAQAAQGSFTYISVYLAPILLFIFAWPFISQIIRTSLQLKTTSIADLLSARFGKSQNLAVLITLVALIGTLPYITLQLKAIIDSFVLLQNDHPHTSWQLGLTVSAILAGFTIIFGVRTIDITERHPGVMIAIAFESVVKLVGFLLVGLFVSFYIYSSPLEIWQQSSDHLNLTSQFEPSNLIAMVGMLFIVMSAFLCLPRQFQVMFVEIKDQKTSQLARWVLPLYILVFAFFAGPIGLAGNLTFGDTLQADAYVLFLPASAGQQWLSLFAFLGAVSAASSMVIVSTIALSTMLSNEIVFPVLFKYSRKKHHNFNHFQSQLLQIRKLLVLFVIGLSFGMLMLSPADALSSLGEVAFGAIAQIGPTLLGAFFWRRVTLTGALTAISSGFMIWTTLNLLPQLGFYQHPLANSSFPATTVATLIALGVNICTLWIVSLLTRQNIREQMQSKFFYQTSNDALWTLPKVDRAELEFLLARFIGQEKAVASLQEFALAHPNKNDKAFNQALILHAEDTLARIIGSASAKLVTSFALGRHEIAFDQVAKIVEENSTQQLEFSRTVLQSAIENVTDGISVIDNQLNLVAWNQQYLDVFNYPKELIYIGCPISKLIHYNLSQRKHLVGDIHLQVQKRVQYLREGNRNSSVRKLNNGRFIHIQGNPVSGGGFVTIFSDITAYRQTEKDLKEQKYDLESRVRARTTELEQANKELELANQELAQARQKAEQAHFKKSQYLKACSHDLLQPLSAARLFSSAVTLSPRVSAKERKQVEQINSSLELANDLLLDLNEIARIESGNISPNIKPIAVEQLFSLLQAEFSGLTEQYQVEFHCQPSRRFISSDITLLTRIIQNFLSNAFRYANHGKVLLGCRRQGDMLSIQVVDNGPGIPHDKQQQVFEQFTQLATEQVGPKGLGLGLNIAQSLAQLLSHPINLKSQAGHGCLFSVNVPITTAITRPATKAPLAKTSLKGVGVLCIDNEPTLLEAMSDLLTAWQCKVFTASSAQQAIDIFSQHEDQIDILLVDFQLGEHAMDTNVLASSSQPVSEYDGISLISKLKSNSHYPLPAILITATTDEQVLIRAQQAQIGYLRKVIKPIALRALMSALLSQNLEDNYTREQ